MFLSFSGGEDPTHFPVSLLWSAARLLEARSRQVWEKYTKPGHILNKKNPGTKKIRSQTETLCSRLGEPFCEMIFLAIFPGVQDSQKINVFSGRCTT